ncbi:MAG: Type 4 prepilin-like proteins leader peptide-processing enzyme [Burkholderiaceae bacterium]|nr:Type 4 prepilin-like proteins leader peptide-processing enzyme [Burkholderiaceae bacterium]
MASALPDWLLHPATLALTGLAIGSFLNVVIHRLPAMLERDWWRDALHQLSDTESYRRVFGAAAPESLLRSGTALQTAVGSLQPLSLARPASSCPSCGHRIRIHENIPLLSWLALRGRCSSCRARISARYPLVELSCAALFAAVGWRLGAQPQVWLWCGFAAALLALAWIDWDTTVLPDAITLPLLWAGLLCAGVGWTIPPVTSIIGACAGYLSLWTVYWIFKLATGKEGMGYGDFKLLAALGAWLGWQALLPIVLGASVIGAAVGIAMKFGGALREGRYVPFGPFLAGAGVLVMLVGTSAVQSWIGLA